jgi:preprotein translocase subunit SecG
MIYFPLKRVKYLMIVLFLLIMVHVSFLTYGYSEPRPGSHGKILYMHIFPEYSILFIYFGYFLVLSLIVLSIKYIDKNTENEKKPNSTN